MNYEYLISISPKHGFSMYEDFIFYMMTFQHKNHDICNQILIRPKLKLCEFLEQMLGDNTMNPFIIRWVHKIKGVFSIYDH